ncbi:hypothetical protein KDH_08170 [Dictyobacter sp. S3.2.2.5]|uniref:Uncharacterized protein n=1 Tax=Dictyobacter halimunensis TaxID=3026934 RepID=A0ABQ6FN63_9CHLR|nr:hypothetical protein KDH_08170 [Dictyobacter sp. S3.2.2.5]
MPSVSDTRRAPIDLSRTHNAAINTPANSAPSMLAVKYGSYFLTDKALQWERNRKEPGSHEM